MAKLRKQLDAMIEEMLFAARAHCADIGIEMSTLGRIIMNDGAFFKTLEGSGNCTIKTYRKVMQWFKDYEHEAIPTQKVNECRL
jgi:hypothetical protein